MCCYRTTCNVLTCQLDFAVLHVGHRCKGRNAILMNANVRYIKTYLSNVFPFPLWQINVKKSQKPPHAKNRFSKLENVFRFCCFYQTFLKSILKIKSWWKYCYRFLQTSWCRSVLHHVTNNGKVLWKWHWRIQTSFPSDPSQNCYLNYMIHVGLTAHLPKIKQINMNYTFKTLGNSLNNLDFCTKFCQTLCHFYIFCFTHYIRFSLCLNSFIFHFNFSFSLKQFSAF